MTSLIAGAPTREARLSLDDHRNTSPTATFRTRSTSPMYAATISTVAITTSVDARSSDRVGQLTFVISTRTSFTNPRNRSLHDTNFLLPPFASPSSPSARRRFAAPSAMAGLEGFEPPTPGFGDRCSSRTELQAYFPRDRSPASVHATDLAGNSIRLSSLLVLRVLATERTVLPELDAIGMQSLVLRRDVVPSLAVVARQR